MNAQNHFTKKEVKFKESFGKILKNARKKRKKNLEFIADKIKVRKVYLQAIEEGNFALLPAPIYTQGFIIKYAKFLALDAKLILELYKKDLQNFQEQKNTQPEKEKLKINLPFLDVRRFKIIAIVLIVLVLLAYLLYQFLAFVNNPFIALEEPSKDLKTSEPSVIFKGQTEKDAKIFINDQEVFTDEQGNFNEKIILQKGMNKIITKVINKFNKEQDITRNIFYEPEEGTVASASDQKNSDEKETGFTLEIKDSPVWIVLKIDDQTIFEKTVEPCVMNFPVKEKIYIKSGKAGNTYLKINGQDLGALGADAQVVEKEFKLEEIIKNND